MTAFMLYLIVGSQELLIGSINDGLLTRVNLPIAINIIGSIFLGYLIGQIFCFVRVSDDQILNKDYVCQPMMKWSP